MRRYLARVAGFFFAAGLLHAQTGAQQEVVLDRNSVWRSFSVLKPPVVALDTGIVPVASQKKWLDKETAAAPAGWVSADFSDASWMRGPATRFPRTPYLSNLCLRGRFEVTDPSQAKGLTLTVSYYGGAVVYVNGKEVGRQNLPQGAVAASTLADGYPAEAFVGENGTMISSAPWASDYRKAIPVRERKLEVSVPADLLRRGTNVVAVLVVRAPYNKVIAEEKHLPQHPEVNKANAYNCNWNTCEVTGITVRAAGSGAVSSAKRPEGYQVWTSDLLVGDVVTDYGDRCEEVRPVVIRGARNGWYSGKVVVGSNKAIEGLKAEVSELRQGREVIPVSAVRVRYAVASGSRADSPMDTLLEKPLEVFPASGGGCVVPIWVTVKVPKGAKAGVYEGKVKVSAKDGFAAEVPVKVEVADYALPDQQDWRFWIEVMQSPDSVAARYEVPLWSEKHWELLEAGMRYIAEIGCRVVHIPVIAQTNSGNAQGMVRWVKREDGSMGYDWTVMDRYLDMAVKYMGKPKMVVFTVWESYLKPPAGPVEIKETDSDYVKMEKSWAAAKWNLRDKGPAVSALNPQTGEVLTVHLPRYEDPAAKEVWKPFFEVLRKKMAQRGLEEAMYLGMASDIWPSKEEVTVIQEVSGNLPWVMHTHGGNRVGQKMHGIAPVGYIAYVWNTMYATDSCESLLGWKRPELYAEFRRFGALNDWPWATILLFPEIQITGAQRGLGRIGADFWPVIKNRQGVPTGRVWENYPQSLWHSCNLFTYLLNPGPDGPVASARYELLREGIQQCEARIDIERVLTDDALKAKLDPALASEAQNLLRERICDMFKAYSILQLTGRTWATATGWGYAEGGLAGHLWYVSSGWQEKAQKLYELAGKVQKITGR